MALRILRFLAILAVALFALRAYAHQIECEKEVGVVQLDAEGRVVLGADGLPVFASPPSTVLPLDTYPVAIGWRVRVNNLAFETSIISGFEDPYLAALAGVEVFGTVPAEGVEIPLGESIEAVVVERIGSFDQCSGMPQGIAGTLVEGAPVCRAARENVAFITTHADATGCRGKVICEPEEPALPAIVSPPPLPPPPPPPPGFEPL